MERFVEIGKAHNLSKSEIAKLGSNWLLGESSRIINASNIDFTDFALRVSPERLARLTDLLVKGSITGTTAKPVLEEMYRTGQGAEDIINRQGLSQISDQEALEAEVVAVISSNHKAVADYKAGKTEALKFLVGQVMRATKGRANPGLVSELLKGKLEGQ
ncbi:MAG TPA: hypothetical protein G4N90_02680 [Dehalococcoidia bacterium]|nr:hypothetical protein [Dehalococcoidia bacterium]